MAAERPTISAIAVGGVRCVFFASKLHVNFERGDSRTEFS